MLQVIQTQFAVWAWGVVEMLVVAAVVVVVGVVVGGADLLLFL